MCSRTWRAWSTGAPRASRRRPSIDSRYATSGAFASTTICLPPGSLTIRSGRNRPSAGRRGLLLEEVAVIEHARELDDALELQLAPVAAHVRLAQSLHEIAGLAVQRVQAGAERADLLVELGGGRRAIHLDLPQLDVHLLERVDQRLHHLRNRLLPLVEIRDGARLHLAQRGSREAQHRLAVLLERLGRERAERVPQRLFGRLEQRVAIGRGREIAFEPRLLGGGAEARACRRATSCSRARSRSARSAGQCCRLGEPRLGGSQLCRLRRRVLRPAAARRPPASAPRRAARRRCDRRRARPGEESASLLGRASAWSRTFPTPSGRRCSRRAPQPPACLGRQPSLKSVQNNAPSRARAHMRGGELRTG